MRLLDRGTWDANTWRPGGQSWFTPLHQAAWHGDAHAADRLLDRGGWRGLLTADGRTPQDVAAERGHHALAEHLAPPPLPDHVERDVFTLLDHYLAGLITDRTSPTLDPDRLRYPQCRVLTECPPGTQLWFPVPGMYGGFSIELRSYYLYVRSWSRVVGGSGQAHVVTGENVTLVERGFV